MDLTCLSKKIELTLEGPWPPGTTRSTPSKPKCCARPSKRAQSRRETWMNDQLPMFGQETSPDTPSATSSPAAGSGRSRSSKPAGPTKDPSGPAAVHVHPSLLRAKGRGLMMLVTSGLSGIPSSASAALQSSLESRLLPRLDMAGSTLFVEIWKRKVTPLRRRYWEHTASARRTSGKDFTSVPTPQASDNTGGGQAKRALETRRPSGAAASANLNDYAMLASVPTPMAGSPATETYNAAGNPDYSRKIVELASITTPSKTDGDRGGTMTEAMSGSSLVQMATLSAVPSPCTPNGGRSMDPEKMDATGKT